MGCFHSKHRIHAEPSTEVTLQALQDTIRRLTQENEQLKSTIQSLTQLHEQKNRMIEDKVSLALTQLYELKNAYECRHT
jgi:prefoldin subunit 5